jgi:predicted nucleic acid-binding Zn ribbon protein
VPLHWCRASASNGVDMEKTFRACRLCSKPIVGRRAQARFCSERCQWDSNHILYTSRQRDKRRALGKPMVGDVVPCYNPQCTNAAVYVNMAAYCQRSCMMYVFNNKDWIGEGPSSRIQVICCGDCGTYFTIRPRTAPVRFCSDCVLLRAKAHDARKTHRRRAIGPEVLSAHQIAERDGVLCRICQGVVDMSLSGNHKWGPTIEHLIPVSKGGTNDHENLALAHRHCNVRRGVKDYPAVLLVS